MNFSNMTNVINSAIRENNELLNMDKEEKRKISYEQLEKIKSIAESSQQQLVGIQKQIEFMEKQMENYERENRNSKKQSRISIIISIIAIAATIISATIPQLFALF